MNTVVERIRAEISLHDVITFARFMELALYCPDCGYYEKENDRLGRRGDFYTSVSVGRLFGELLAFQFAEWLAKLSGKKLQLMEAGAHDGQLAKDILTWLQKWRPELFTQLEYIICEPSERRKGWQRETLQQFGDQIHWISGLNRKVDGINGVIFSNELLDSLPVHRLSWDARRREWFEWGVGVVGDHFVWRRIEKSKVLSTKSPALQWLHGLPLELLAALPDGFVMEICPTAEKWWREAATTLQHGWLMTLDYGLTSVEFLAPHRINGTLRAYHQHKVCENVLANAGEQDLTAHVHFDSVQRAGEAAGLRTDLLTKQANFFAGIMKGFWSEMENRDAWTSARTREFQTLVHPEHLGRAFRVLVQTR